MELLWANFKKKQINRYEIYMYVTYSNIHHLYTICK